jgi:4-hydroxy-3-polyprenylbenzoate decarboxylase
MSLPLIVGISGATGVIYGIEVLKVLHELGNPAHLILSETAVRNFGIETDYSTDDVRKLAAEVYSNKDLAAAVSSGSFPTAGMLIAPCSMKTLSGIANSFSQNLLIRAADVTLKEQRKLVLIARETPLHKGHLELMVKAADLGAVILPPVPAFYHRPKTIMDIVHQTVGRALDQFGIEHDLFERWKGV